MMLASLAFYFVRLQFSVNRRPASSTHRTCRKDLFSCPRYIRAAAQPSVRALVWGTLASAHLGFRRNGGAN